MPVRQCFHVFRWVIWSAPISSMLSHWMGQRLNHRMKDWPKRWWLYESVVVMWSAFYRTSVLFVWLTEQVSNRIWFWRADWLTGFLREGTDECLIEKMDVYVCNWVIAWTSEGSRGELNEWINVWLIEWMVELMDGWVSEWLVKCVNYCLKTRMWWINEWVNYWADGCTSVNGCNGECLNL